MAEKWGQKDKFSIFLPAIFLPLQTSTEAAKTGSRRAGDRAAAARKIHRGV
jgi:hypothetical protein